MLLANLPAHSKRDNGEYSAFTRIIGHDEWFSDVQYGERWYAEGYGKRRIDDWKAGVHILSLTKSISEYMFDEYAGTEGLPASGACLILGFEEFDNSREALIHPLYNFRDTFYDNEKGDLFALFKRIDDRVFAATGKRILFSKMPRYSEFYKGHGYRKDEEARLSFNTRYAWESFKIFIPNHYSITHYGQNENIWGALSLPIFDIAEPKDVFVPIFGFRRGLPSPHFKIVVRGITFAKNITEPNRKLITELMKTTFPSARID